MTEVFHELSVIGDPVTDEDQVVYLLASLPESFNVLATANSEVPEMDLVIERLLHEERKTKDRTGDVNSENAMTAKHQRRGTIRCHYCYLI